MKRTVFILFFLFSSLVNCQDYIWHKTIGSITADQGIDIQINEQGAQFIIGIYTSMIDFDPNAGVFNVVGNGGSETFIQKLDSSGALVWVKSLQSDTVGPNFGSSKPSALWIDQNGNVIVAGVFSQTVDFDPGLGVYNMTGTNGSNGNQDSYILKLDSVGNFLWAKRIGNNTIQDQILDITADLNGNIYACGMFSNTLDFDPGLGTFNLTGNGVLQGIFLLKLDSNGNFIWAFSEGSSTGADLGLNVSIDGDSNIYMSGYFKGIMDFDPSPNTLILPGSSGYPQAFIQKLTPNGQLIWVKPFPTSSITGSHALDKNDL